VIRRNFVVLKPGWHVGGIVVACCPRAAARFAHRLAMMQGGQSAAWWSLDGWIARPLEAIGPNGLLLGAPMQVRS
jgi:hypothetical protein